MCHTIGLGRFARRRRPRRPLVKSPPLSGMRCGRTPPLERDKKAEDNISFFLLKRKKIRIILLYVVVCHFVCE